MNDVKMGVFTKETVLMSKRRLANMEQSVLEARNQRWYFGGRLLHDRMKIEEIKLQAGFVIQVVVNTPDSKE